MLDINFTDEITNSVLCMLPEGGEFSFPEETLEKTYSGGQCGSAGAAWRLRGGGSRRRLDERAIYLDEALVRVAGYEAAGADCVYVPFPGTLHDQARIRAATTLTKRKWKGG